VSEKRIFAIVGLPVLHSRSPQIYQQLFRIENRELIYTRLAVQRISEAISVMDDLGISGYNITAPFKKNVLRHLNEVSEPARKMCAVNTVVRKDGKLVGYNTDIDGVIGALQSNGIELSGNSAVVIGAGGAGRAATFGLLKTGAKVILVNRSVEKAEKIAKSFGCEFAPMENLADVVKNAKIIVSALPAGVDVIADEWLTPNHVLLDANYHSEILKNKAGKRGATFIGGESWLIHQAIPAYRHFTGSQKKMKIPKIIDFNSSMKNIALVGFMGVGKSFVGKSLAKLLGWKYIDTDDEIVEKTGKSISQIFSEYGESEFREMEREVIQSVVRQKCAVISCGGGVVLDQVNRRQLIDNSLTVWIYAPVKTALSRIDLTSRPLLSRNVSAVELEAEKIFRKRRDLYAEVSDLVVINKRWSSQKTAELIYEEVCSAFGHLW